MRYLATALLLGVGLSVCAQRVRLDSLEKVLVRQPEENVERSRTLTAIVKTCSSIDPKRAQRLSIDAVALARKLKDERALAMAWIAQRSAYQYLGRAGDVDSLTLLIRASALRTRDPLIIGINNGWTLSTEDLGDSAQYLKSKAQFAEGLTALRSLKDPRTLADGLYTYGSNTWYYRDALLLEEALALYRAQGDSSGVGTCLIAMNNFEPYANDGKSIERIEYAVSLFEADGNRMWTTWMRNMLTWYYLERADYLRAASNARASLATAEELGLPNDLMVAEAGLADLYVAIGDLRPALDHHLRGWAYQGENMDYRLNALNSIGRTYRLFSMRDSARHYLELAIKENPYTGDNLRLAESRGFMAELLAEENGAVQAVELFNTALEVHRKYPHNYVQEVYFSLGLGRLLANADADRLKEMKLARAKADAEAIALLEHTAELGGTQHMCKEQMEAFHELAALYERNGDMAKAFAYQKQHLAMKDSVMSVEKAKAVARQESAFEEAKRTKALRAEQATKDAAAREDLDEQHALRNWLVGGVLVIALVAGIFFLQRNRTRREKARSDEILHNVLPEEVAREIKATGTAQSREIDQVSVLFTDFKGFTELSATLSRQELMAEIDACFKAFDEISHHHGVERIKTIGDSYMAAAGLKGDAGEAAVNTVRVALRMQAFVEARKAERDQQGLPAFQMRVGIHTGPVVAGIVGVKKFQYDIWGDTVNTASRMESSGEVGQVNIGESTYALVKDEPGLAFTSRGKVQAKGKGEMEMYFVTRT